MLCIFLILFLYGYVNCISLYNLCHLKKSYLIIQIYSISWKVDHHIYDEFLVWNQQRSWTLNWVIDSNVENWYEFMVHKFAYYCL